jgi:hypothetical protein
MQSQSTGRRTKRFFVLRNNLLSYHKVKPVDEEAVLGSYNINTIHIDEASAIEIGRRRFQRYELVSSSAPADFSPFTNLLLQ